MLPYIGLAKSPEWHVTRHGGTTMGDDWEPTVPARYTSRKHYMAHVWWEVDFRAGLGLAVLSLHVGHNYHRECARYRIRSQRQALRWADAKLREDKEMLFWRLQTAFQVIYDPSTAHHVYRELPDGRVEAFCSLFPKLGSLHTQLTERLFDSYMMPCGQFYEVRPNGSITQADRRGGSSTSGGTPPARILRTLFRWTRYAIPPV